MSGASSEGRPVNRADVMASNCYAVTVSDYQVNEKHRSLHSSYMAGRRWPCPLSKL